MILRHLLIIIIVILLLAKAPNCFCQYNLVLNPSFESHTVICANIKGGGNEANNWISPTINAGITDTYDYFNVCASCCGVPLNTDGFGYQYAHTGVAYVGFITMYQTTTPNFRNYVQTKLLDTLRANHSYYIEFYINLSNAFAYPTNNVGLLVGDTAIISNESEFVQASPQILQYGNPVITDTLNWVKVGGVYKAHGGEQYITIGNFNDDAQTATSQIQGGVNPGGAYFLDDVSVIPLDSMLLYADAGRDTTINKGDSAWIGSRLCGLTNVVWYDSANGKKDSLAANVPGMWVKPTVNTYYIITQNINGFYSSDTVWVGVVQPMPVVLAWFRATSPQPLSQGEGQNPLLSWETLTEVNVSQFNVQRSLDGKGFETVGVVKAKGAGEYSFVDTAPLSFGEGPGVRYYRLEIIDKDGSKSYSKVLSINNYQLSTIDVYPNPTNGEINIALPENGKWQITATDIMGRVLWQQTCDGCDGLVKHNITGAKGLYIIKINNTGTGQQTIKKITLQ